MYSSWITAVVSFCETYQYVITPIKSFFWGGGGSSYNYDTDMQYC